MSEFGMYLKELRGSKSFREMERITGLSHTYLSTLEKGVDPRSGKERKPTPETLMQLSKTLNVSYSELMEKAGYKDVSNQLEKAFNDFINASEKIEMVTKMHTAKKKKLIYIKEHKAKIKEYIENVNEEIKTIKSRVENIENDSSNPRVQIELLEKQIELVKSVEMANHELASFEREVQDLNNIDYKKFNEDLINQLSSTKETLINEIEINFKITTKKLER